MTKGDTVRLSSESFCPNCKSKDLELHTTTENSRMWIKIKCNSCDCCYSSEPVDLNEPLVITEAEEIGR